MSPLATPLGLAKLATQKNWYSGVFFFWGDEVFKMGSLGQF